MYSIVIAIIFFAVGGWLLKVEWAAALSLTMGVAVTLVWLVINFL